MEQYTDEYILKAKKSMEIIEETREIESEIDKENKTSINDETITIFGILTQFENIEILDKKAKIRIPKTFFARTEEEIAEVYFLGSKPQYVYSDGILPFMIALNLTENKVSESEIEQVGKLSKQILERVGPKTKILGEQFLKRETGDIYIIKMINQTINSSNYTMMFYTSLENKFLIGSISFDTRYSKRLISVAEEIVNSFEITKKEEE